MCDCFKGSFVLNHLSCYQKFGRLGTYALGRLLVDQGRVGIVIFCSVLGSLMVMVWSLLEKLQITLSVSMSKGCPKRMSYAGDWTMWTCK